MWACYAANSARLLHSRLPAVNAPISCHRPPEPAANQNAPISKNSKSPNPKSLRQHTPAGPIPPCCFYFCPRNRPFHHTNNQVSPRTRSSTRSSFSGPSHISSAFALLLLLPHLSLHAYRICPGTSSFNHGQPRTYASANGPLRNADRLGGMG